MYSRTLDEIVAEDSEVGAEQIESLKDKVQNILYLFLFESSIVLTTIIAATGFMYLVDVYAGLFITALTIFNLLWFFILNTTLDEKMEPVDLAFRRATRRIVEKLNLVASVKAAGVEEKMVEEIASELTPPLQADFKVWGIWFLSIDTIRRVINMAAPILLLMYGVLTHTWTPGTLAAVSSWAFMISREYGFIGHLMRHLASQVARIKATREALSKAPAFNYHTGIVYRRKLS
jgi:ABC-type multidrug transport system fused ATPase/permease subunit